ncbi:MAG TPA: YfiR family protein [Salinivirgaceae bacterium]|nr:YfiR family protein [Salinivirgaceae bacterium]
MRRLFIVISLLLVTQGNNAPINITAMKALYIERFTQFIDWPNNQNSSFFIIQIADDYELYELMKNQFSNYRIKDRPIKITFSNFISDSEIPHILYIGNEMSLPSLLKKTNRQPILTVAHGEDLCNEGVMINFVLYENRLRFEINETAIRESSLYINFRLLNMAIKVVQPISKP